jgi:hypothetical protein
VKRKVTTTFSLIVRGKKLYNIRMDLRETGWEGVEWIYLAQDRLVVGSYDGL